MTPHWSAIYSKPIVFVVLTLVAAGIYLAFAIPIAVFPETDFPRIVVGADNGVTPIDQMLVTVTRPIEEAVNSVQGLERVLSVTSRGTVEVNLFFDWKIDMFRTLERVNAAMARAQANLPPTTKITVNRLTFAAFPIVGYSLTSSTVPQTRLWELATYEIKPRLNRLHGVSTVVLQGGREPEFEVSPDPGKLLEAGLTIPLMLEAIRKTNVVDSPGLIEANHQLVLGLVSGQARTPDQIGSIVLKTTPSGAPIHIADVATVRPSEKPIYTAVSADGKPALLLNINRQPDGNTVEVADLVRNEVDSIRKTLPKGIEVKPFYDQSELVIQSIKSVRDAILIGLALAAIILVLFLRDWGSSIVAGLVIPATIAITFIVLRLMGQSFNLMTLGGLAAAVGLVIDDAIVVVENIVLHRDSGQSRGDAIRLAILEIRKPLIGSTVTPIVVFIPLILISGVPGVFFRALGVTVCASLLASLGLALTWTPALSHLLLRKPRENQTEHDPRAGALGRVIGFYERVLRLAMGNRWAVALVSLLLIVASYFGFNALGSDLLPEMDEGGFILDYFTPAGASLAETNRIIGHIESLLHSVPEVETTSRRTGLQLGLASVTEANRGDFTVKLKEERKRNLDDVISDVRERVAKAEPTLKAEYVKLLSDMIGDLSNAPEPIHIKMFSQNAALLREWGPKLGDAIEKAQKKVNGKEHGVVDVLNGIDNTISGPALLFQVDPAIAARAGFATDEVELAASALMQGEPASAPVVVNDRAYTIRVRFPNYTRDSIESIRNTLLSSGNGSKATLGTLARVEEIPGQTEIRRENQQREIAVTGRLEGVSLGEGIQSVKDVVAKLGIPSSIRIGYGGAYEEQQRSFRDLAVVLMLAIVLVFTVLLFEFGSFSAPVAILSSALLSTAGVIAALFVTKTSFNISSFMD